MAKEGSAEKRGILAFFVVSALLGYPIVAQTWDPPLEPTRTIIHLQALWNDGMYGVFITYFTTFLVMVAVVLYPLVLFLGLHSLVARTPKTQNPSLALPTGSSLTWRRGGDFALAAGGLAFLLGPVGFFYLVFTKPEKLSFLGSSGGFALFFAVFFPMLGVGMLFDAALPKQWHQGRIESMAPNPSTDGSPPTSYELVIQGKKHTIVADLAAKLKVEEKIALRISRVFDRVTELRR